MFRSLSEMTCRSLMLNSVLQITKFSEQIQRPLALVYVPSHQNISNPPCNFVAYTGTISLYEYGIYTYLHIINV